MNAPVHDDAPFHVSHVGPASWGIDVESEEWRIVEEFPSYAVSSLGNVKRIIDCRTIKAGHIIRQRTLYGYKYVGLSLQGKVFSRRVHRLVCIAFHGPAPDAQSHAAHADGTRGNNAAHNIKWATPSENMMDKHRHGTMPVGERNGARLHPERLARGVRNGKYTKPEKTPRGERHGMARLTSEDVKAIRQDNRPRRAIACAYGVSKCTIDGVKTGKTWKHIP